MYIVQCQMGTPLDSKELNKGVWWEDPGSIDYTVPIQTEKGKEGKGDSQKENISFPLSVYPSHLV